jgi:chitinase
MKKFLCHLALLMIGIISYGQTARVVGYLPTYRFSLSNQIEYCKLTHLNLAFANPDSLGNLTMPGITAIISDALADNPSLAICISLGGAGLSEQQKKDWSNLIDIPANRPDFISRIVDFVLANNLDGVDMDLEWGDVTSGYSGFVTELDTALTSQNLILTVAFPNQKWYSNVSRAALDAFDFINIMSYDATGPWNPSSPGQHSSYSFSVNGINYWKNTAGISGSRLTLGLPFYGYDFVNSSEVSAFTYASMVAADESYADLDNVGNKFYNGRPTIASKVELANNEVSGIMIWELGQDSFNEYSLLTTIHNKYTSLGIFTSGLCGNETASVLSNSEIQDNTIIYPNPASDFITIEGKDLDLSKLKITNALGQIISIGNPITTKDELFFDVSELPAGVYFILIINKDDILSQHKFIVI